MMEKLSLTYYKDERIVKLVEKNSKEIKRQVGKIAY